MPRILSAGLAVILLLPGTAAGDGTIARFRRDAAWLAAYDSLLRGLAELPGMWESIIAPPGSGPQDEATFRLVLESSDNLLLVSRYKQQAIDPDTGKPVSGLFIDVVMKIRDTNRDGVPDEFRGEPFDPFPDEEILDNGFIKIRDVADHYAILVQWDTVMSLATKTLVR